MNLYNKETGLLALPYDWSANETSRRTSCVVVLSLSSYIFHYILLAYGT
jgi:hypothetical protein